MDNPAPLNILSLCTGIGGLDLGVELAVPGARTVCGVEREAYCVEVLARRMEEKAVGPFPVWSDLRTFDGKPWRGVVDCVTAGYPCQPFSVAGKRRGADDPRHLWPHVARIIRECGPALCFLENVGGHLRLGAREVLRELHGMGYRTAAGLFTAEEVGASHKRERLFILGALADGGEQRRPEVPRGSSGDEAAHGRAGRDRLKSNGDHVADGEGAGLVYTQSRGCGIGGEQREGWRGADAQRDGADVDHAQRPDARAGDARIEGCTRSGRDRSAIAGDDLADAGGERSQGQRAGRAAAGATRRGNGALGAFPPGPGELDAWRSILAERPDLAPATQSGVRGVVDGPAHRMDRLRCLGNGVVPLAAAHAFTTLARELL